MPPPMPQMSVLPAVRSTILIRDETRCAHVEGFQCVPGRYIEANQTDLRAVRRMHSVNQILIAAAEVATPVCSAQ